ncbi:MAG TPA: extracellular solute-binding protein [Bacillota bacterium]
MIKVLRKKWLFGVLLTLVVVQLSFALAAPKGIKTTIYNFGLQNDRLGRALELPNKNGEMTKWVNNKFGLELNYEYVLDANKQEQMTLWSASGEYPESFVYTTHAAVFNWGRNMKYANLDPYYNDPKNFPRLYEIKHKYPRTLAPLTNEGHIVGFPTRMNYKVGVPNPDIAYTFGWWIRDDILKSLGGVRPTTLDEFTEMLRKIKTGNFKSPSGKPVIPLLLPPADWYSECTFFQTFGLNWIGMTKTGWYQFWGMTKQGYEAMKYANQLFNEGLIDPDWVTQKDDMFQEKQRNGSAAVIVGWLPYTLIEDVKKAGYNFSYTALPVPKVPGVSRSYPWNVLAGPDSDMVLYVTSKASKAQCDRLAKLAEWALTIEGARSLYLGASPDMIELKKSGPYKGTYWFKDQFKDLDWYVNGDTRAARIKHGVVPLNGPVSYTRAELKVPDILGNQEKWAKENYKWLSANGNIAYWGDVGPEFVPDEVVSINNRIWSEIPPMLLRACVLPADQFEATYKQAISTCKQVGFTKLCDDQWTRRKAYIDKNGGKKELMIPDDYPYADFLEEFK